MTASRKPPVATEPLFREEQRFRQGGLWVLLAGVSVISGLPIAARLCRQILEGDAQSTPGDDEPATSEALRLAVLGGVAGLMAAAKLEVEVRPGTLRIRFWPLFVKRKIPLADIERAEAVTYRPLRDYGGWGVRHGAKGKAYNVSGDRGVRLTLSGGGGALLIGSQRAEALAAAIRQARGGR